ncbi:MAG: MFS transporter [Dehalococcoidia bacterium]
MGASYLRDRLSPAALRTTFTSLSEPEYAWYFVGNAAFFMGMQMQFLLRGFLAFEITDSAAALGYISVSVAFPMLFIAPFGGVVADRVNKRTLLIVTQMAAAAASLVLAILILTDLVRFWHLVVVAIATGAVFSFNMPARQALVPNLVPQHKLMNAISLQMGGMNLTRIVAPALAGLLIAPLGIGWVYMLTFGLFVVASLSELHLPRHGMVSQTERGSFKDDFMGGFRYIMGDSLMQLLLVAGVILPIFSFPVQQLLPVFAKEVFGSESGVVLGLLAAATGVGGLAGAIVAANFDDRPSKGRHMLFGGLAMATFLFCFAVAPSLKIALIVLVVSGVGQMIFTATNNTVIQATLPQEVRGRVMAVMMMSFGLMPLGVVPVTIGADAVGAPTAVAVSSAALFVAIVLLFTFSRRLRTLRLASPGHSELSPVQAAELVAVGKLTQEEADRLTGVRHQSTAEIPAPQDQP